MKIKNIISQHRRDGRADMECEHCGHIQKDVYFYDDANFHENIIPTKKCEKCGEIAPEDYRALSPKYKPHQQV